MCEFFGCDYCALLTVNMLCHVEVMFINLLNLLERYYLLIFEHLQTSLNSSQYRQVAATVDLYQML